MIVCLVHVLEGLTVRVMDKHWSKLRESGLMKSLLGVNILKLQKDQQYTAMSVRVKHGEQTGHLYSSLRAVPDYGCRVSMSAAETFKKLQICGGALKTSPVSVMQVEMREMPL